MKLLDRLLGRSPPADPDGAEGIPQLAEDPAAAPVGAARPSPAFDAPPVSLDRLVIELLGLLFHCAGEPPDPEVVCARLGDTCRDLGLSPVDPAELRQHAQALDENGWMRLWLLALGARLDVIRPSLRALAEAMGAPGLVLGGFVGVATGTPLLTMELLLTSRLRLEELARRWLHDLGASIEGETPEESREALDRLDYARLLAELDRAKLSAEERLAYLKKLQDEHDAKHGRRGKW
jgi:hypothetical protein